ncbi:hypothetical protein UFOVP451_39 [uncultured Caudovirales phage]|uniref:Uncharacterized protein n=1 Tax=uncultured Caudovirales phage TaxID=2100421 RepID=A0A6J5MC15_9CAUD|nr:hypothetical protein UFOVP451_39 [uncultured Caudovirales phage]
MESNKKSFDSLLDGILHFQALRARCQKGEHDEIMYTKLIDERVILLEKVYRELPAQKQGYMQRSFAHTLIDAIIENDSLLKGQRAIYDRVTETDNRIIRTLGYGYEILKYDSYDTFRVTVYEDGHAIPYSQYYYTNDKLIDINNNEIDIRV